ncbi:MULTISPECIES: HI0074 family nucleotidyltransferase substrate-binding subunit [Succinivibrio]|uniref:Nucleotidyltransferase substrate binding protein n=1 Tax=Succinivibrio faecicola TaxID=2820300 RepID=A0ABS7DFE9_9GAMM|nr:HI0074 family nucleotidyltransferase substrate-binding subunit [Succinivibrio faecicola]MBW7570028.1 nucleotidyltransferase substrate binding protein [Succinivibrio faecicola]
MKKFENFSNCLKVLKKADFELTFENEIYRTGVIAQFNLTFELSWKALQEVLRIHGVEGADVGSPREILQLAYKVGFISDSESWLLMLKKRNSSVHVYNEDDADELVSLIRDKFISAFNNLEETLKIKIAKIAEFS